MGKYTIETHPERCTGCLRCQLACSDANEKIFNPSIARISIEISGVDCKIHFTEACIGCGICADECFYNAVEKRERVGGK
jgi:carbon-monoxide dehydrogenase iron sulfur subunit